MLLKAKLPIVLMLIFACAVVHAQDFPLWEQLLKRYGGETDATSVPSMKMGGHMQMSLKAQSKAGDENRASDIVVRARRVLEHYANVDAAVRDGYKPFHPSGKIGEEIHYSNYRYGQLERRHVDYDRPGSILYKRTANGLVAVGVMYTAPRDATTAQLDAIAPLSIATWHRHIDFCGGPRTIPLSEQFGPNARFGPQGRIHSADECLQAHGLWIPVVFGWMTHVYPNASSPDKMWGGMDMEMDAMQTSE